MRPAWHAVFAALELPENVICIGNKRSFLHKNILFVGAVGWCDGLRENDI